MRVEVICFIVVAFGLVALYSFAPDNPYFTISKADVEVKTPKGFPPPVYDFKNNKPTPDGFVLGRKLFYDPILSKDSSTSCAFCHQRIAAFAHIDHQLSHGINGLIGKRNVPAIQNMIWGSSFMWDGAINHLEMQPLAPMSNATEMADTLPNVLNKLQQRADYRDLFKKAFGDTVVTSQRMLKALAQFTGLMISANSRYDKYLRGNEKFTAQEEHGLQLFRANCENCHKEPLFTDNTFRDIGLAPDANLKDYGRKNITGMDSDFMKFKVPSLRNVAMTYPYMHDGRFKSLAQVLAHYSDGKFFSNNFDKSISKMVGMQETDKADIIAFLKTLTDKEFLYDRRFADPNFR